MGLFWAIGKSNRLFGMLIIIFAYTGEDYVDDRTRIITFVAMTAISIFGVFGLFFIITIVERETLTFKETIQTSTKTVKKRFELEISDALT